jgi:hypothetical protein
MFMAACFCATACDFCGGGSIGLDIGVLSGNNGNYIGLQTAANQYKGLTEDAQTTWLMNWTLKGGYAPVEKVQLAVFLPVYLQVNPGPGTGRAGIGDLLLMAVYHPLEKWQYEKELVHKITLSGGIEMPTGMYREQSEMLMETIPFGSKSVDFLAGVNYMFGVKRYTLSIAALGKYNLRNKYDYRYGKSLESILQHSYRFTVKDGSLQPFAGWKFNVQSRDVSGNFYRDFTGGKVFSQLVGMQWSYYNYRIAAQAEIPLYQDLKNINLKNGNTYSLQFSYHF